MNIPNKLKICGQMYDILIPYKFSERGDIVGQCDNCCLKIKLSTIDCWTGNKLPESVIAENFLHEILHAVDSLSGHLIFKDNEPAIEGIAALLFQTLRDNKLNFSEKDGFPKD